MVLIRPFAEGDNARMLEIERLCPQGDQNCSIGVDKKGDVIGRYKLFDNWNVMVAEDGGKVGGWIGWTLKDDTVRGKKYVYIAEVMVHPEFRRKGVATQLVNEAEKDAVSSGSDHIYCYIYGPNHASKALFERLGYRDMTDIEQCALAAYKRSSISKDVTIENVNEKDLPGVVDLINEYNSGRSHFTPFTTESFKSYINGIPGYGWDQFWSVKREDEIVACAGLWNAAALAELYYAKQPAVFKLLGGMFRVIRPFIKLPKIAAEGEYFNFRTISNPAFAPDASDAMLSLLGYFNNYLMDAEIDYAIAIVDKSDPVFEIVKKGRPQIEIWKIFAKPLNGDLAGLNPLYIDIRDLIP